MKLRFLSSLILCLAVVAFAQPSGLVTKSASGSSSAIVYFQPPAHSAPVAGIDVTSDKSQSTLQMQVGDGARYSLLVAAAGNAKAITVSGSGLASNDLLLAVSGASVWPIIVTNSTGVTNVTLTLENPIGTNVAVNDTVREVSTSTFWTTETDVGATSNLFFVNAARNAAADDIVVIEKSPSTWTTNKIATYTTNALLKFRLATTLPVDVPYGIVVREFSTNPPALLLADCAANATTLHVSRTNGFLDGGGIIVVRQTGAVFYGTLHASGVALTNLTLATALGVPLTAGDSIYAPTSQEYLVKYPAKVGDTFLNLDTSTGLTGGDRICIVSTPYLLDTRVTANATTNNVCLMTFATANALACSPQRRIYALTTNIYTASIAAAGTATDLTLGAAAGLTNADTILISPATGGHVLRQIRTRATTTYQSVGTIANTSALAVGDLVYLVRTTNSTPIGATTVRISPTSWALPQSIPVRMVLDGTSSCSINAITVNYGQ